MAEEVMAMEEKVKDKVGKQIREWVLPEKEEDRNKELEQTAWLIVHHPKKRASYFEEPEKSLEAALKDAKIKGEENQRKLALLVELLINEDPRLVSSKETFHERESFLSEGVQDPQKTFGAVASMSQLTFLIGVALVLVGVALAIVTVFSDKGTTEQVTVGALGAFFGGSGVVATLVAVFKASTKELRTITSDMAKIHMILTG